LESDGQYSRVDGTTSFKIQAENEIFDLGHPFPVGYTIGLTRYSSSNTGLTGTIACLCCAMDFELTHVLTTSALHGVRISLDLKPSHHAWRPSTYRDMGNSRAEPPKVLKRQKFSY
jgi:hypothetical protein